MSAASLIDQDDDDAATQRDDVLAAINELRAQLGPLSNRRLTFAEVYKNYPEAAPYVFSGRALRNMNLMGSDLRPIDFQGSDMSGCTFTNARIAGASFDLCKISRTALREAADWGEHVAMHVWRRPRSPFRPRPGDRFSLAPYLPELVMLGANMLDDFAELDGDAIKLDSEERSALRKGNLAIALRPLTILEHRAVTEESRKLENGRAELSALQARFYFDKLDELNHGGERAVTEQDDRSSFEKADIPSAGLIALLDACRVAEQVTPSGDEPDLERSHATDCKISDLWIARPKNRLSQHEFVRRRDRTLLKITSTNITKYQAGERTPVERGYAQLRPVFYLNDPDFY